MIRRTMDAAFLNAIANDPCVRPWIGGDPTEPVDLSPILADTENVAIVCEHGGWVLHKLAPGTYEIHTLFGKAGRGSFFRKAAFEMLRWMFTRTDAVEILTKCPDDNPGARMAASWVGFRERFRRADAWKPGVGVSYQALTVDGWSARDPQARIEGAKFHEALEWAKGPEIHQHPEDAAHDHAVGAALLMAYAGQIDKGVAFYNRWAMFAGYAQVARVGPYEIDIQDAMVEIANGSVNVLMVRGKTAATSGSVALA